MKYSEELRRNSIINREELDLYIQRNYVEADMLNGAMSGPASMSASSPMPEYAPLSEPEFMPSMSSSAKGKVPLAASASRESAPMSAETGSFSAKEYLPREDGSVDQKSARPSKKPGLLGMISGKIVCGAGKNAICESMLAEETSAEASEDAEDGSVSLPAESPAHIYAKKCKTEPAKKRAGSAKKKQEVFPEDTLEEEIYEDSCEEDSDFYDYDEDLYSKLTERVGHVEDSFSEYLLFLIGSKGLSNADVYKRALVDKKVFSKIKNNPDYHPQKLTAMCLCIGAMLNLDESRDLLARAGYALSPSDKTDIIFSYFIENGIYDMIELDIQLEEHGLECIIA